MQFLKWVMQFVLITTFFNPSSSQSELTACSNADRAALLGFKASILKDTTGILSTWTGTDCCNGGWEGVECGGPGGRVNRLILQRPSSDSRVFMKGFLSPSLGNLYFLEIIVLSGMKHVSGLIPESFSNLTRLTQLVLDDNSLQGNIPSSLGHLRNIQTLSLSGNQLTGQIPPSLSNLRNLMQLNLAHNYLTGQISPAVGTLTRLQSLDLSFNSLSGFIPEFLGQLQNLTYLVLSRNRFSGEIPNSLCNLVKLSELSVDQNLLTGKIPNRIGNLKSVSVLRLSSNKLTGPIPISISQLQNLWNLNLSRNVFSSSLPETAFAKGLLSLLSIDLSYSGLDLGTVPDWIRNRELSDIHLAGCKLRGLLPNFTKTSSLTTLDLSDNYFTEGISSILINLPNLQIVKISNNLLHSDISVIRLPAQISILDLHSNQLLGSLTGIFNSNRIKFLEAIDVSSNQISGSIPEFSSGLNLKLVNLAKNKITGQIPSSISNLAKLEKLDISRNKLTGTIPPSLGLLLKLQWLDLSINGIAGKIPNSLLGIKVLRHVSFRANRLCGEIPQGRPLNIFPAVAYAHNLCLCDKPLPPCKGKRK